MSIMFQLFSADDLKMYRDKEALIQLRVEVGIAARKPENSFAAVKKDQYLPKVLEDARNIETALDPILKEKYWQDVTQTLRGRAREIFRQCKGYDPTETLGGSLIHFSESPLSDAIKNANQSSVPTTTSSSKDQRAEIERLIKDRIQQEEEIWRTFQTLVLHKNDCDRLSELENEILKLAITCELDYFNEYNAINSVKEFVHDKFRESIGTRAQGPDSLYALLNRIS